MSIIFDPRQGLGDNIYARPFIRAHAATRHDVVVRTPWPQLYRDLPVKFQVPGGTILRTQKKNVVRTDPNAYGVNYLAHTKTVLFHYSLRVKGQTILGEFESIAGWPKDQPFVFDLPTFDASLPFATDKPIAVVRPVTLRHEWPNRARNPDANYIARAAAMLRARGYYVVSVADICPKYEPHLEPLPVADTTLNRGELSVEPLLTLIQRASVVVGGVGWIVPACMAYGTPAVIIGGGNGGHNAPELVTDPRVDCSRIRFILPEHYCRCIDMRHGCIKVIRGFDEHFAVALDAVAPAMGAAA